MSDDQRKTFRCARTPDQQAVLKLRGRDIVVMLGDQSRGGFAVEFHGKLNAKVGQVVRVRTCTGWTEATVIHRQVRDGTTRLGLERVGELPDPREPVWSLKPGKSRNTLGLLVAVIVLFLACQWLVSGWLWGNQHPLKAADVFASQVVESSGPAPSALNSP